MIGIVGIVVLIVGVLIIGFAAGFVLGFFVGSDWGLAKMEATAKVVEE